MEDNDFGTEGELGMCCSLTIGSLEESDWSDIPNMCNIVERMPLIERAGHFCFPSINLQLSLNANNVNVKSGANYIKPI